MKRLFTSISLLILSMVMGAGALAQSTGSYDTTITFMGGTRLLSMYVPATYNAATKYRLMVCLHGLGDNSAAYRNALINSLGWGTNMPNTIFVCPEAATTSSDYFSPAGGEAIIQQSIAVAMGTYHIDTANVILQGFSLGGRAALRYGLNNYATFKGLLLNTPAVQGVKEAVNGGSFYPFNYANASHIPIYITHGATDITYSSALDSTYEQLVLNDGIVRYYDFPGLGHTIPPTAQIINFLTFFNTPYHAGKDLDLVKIKVPARTCNTATPGSLLIRNTGQDQLTNATFQYTLNGTNLTYTWSGTLNSFQHAIVSLPTLTATNGNNTLSAQVTTLNTSVTDTVLSNNQAATGFITATTGKTLPFTENFEGATFPPQDWVLDQSGDFYSSWDLDNTVAKNGNNSAGTFNTILIFDNSGRKEGLLSPVLNLASMANPKVSFDLAYNYHEYTPPYFTANVDFADTLEVLISTDCGGSYTSLFKKGGADLATFSQPIINPLSINDCFIVPADSNWRRVSIDLSAYASSSKAVVRFNYISALGGSINIDNVSFSNTATGVQGATQAVYSVYPNPATDKVTINSGNTVITLVDVVDITGKKLLSQVNDKNATGAMTIDTHSLQAGMYMLQIYAQGGMKTEKLSIRR